MDVEDNSTVVCFAIPPEEGNDLMSVCSSKSISKSLLLLADGAILYQEGNPFAESLLEPLLEALVQDRSQVEADRSHVTSLNRRGMYGTPTSRNPDVSSPTVHNPTGDMSYVRSSLFLKSLIVYARRVTAQTQALAIQVSLRLFLTLSYILTKAQWQTSLRYPLVDRATNEGSR